MVDFGAYIISYNGLTRNLEGALDSLRPIAEDIVVSVDENSDDGTKEWVKSRDDVVYTIHDGSEFPKTEPEMRKNALDKLLSVSDADYMLCLDDDEVLPETKQLSMIPKLPKTDYIAADIYHLWEDNKYRVDAMWGPKATSAMIGAHRERVTSASWPDRGPHCGRMPTIGVDEDGVVFRGGIPLLHFGWRRPTSDQMDKMVSKLERDRYRWENPSITYITEAQMNHYRSFSDSPDLKEIPKEWRSLV